MGNGCSHGKLQRILTGGMVLVMLMAGALAGAQKLTPPRKHATVAMRSGPVVLDGKLDEKAWQAAPLHTGFEMPLGVSNRQPIPEEVQTSFRVLQDETALYFGIRCNEPKMSERTVKAARQHDAAMWSDDDVEIFFDPVGDRTEYYQLAINSEGTQVDLYMIESGNTSKAGWSAEWKAAAFQGPDFWSLEVAVPFGLFHNRPSLTWTENWGFSIVRTRTPAPRYYSMYSTANGYHKVADFGTLGPVKVDRNRFNLATDMPTFRLQPAEKGFAVTGSVKVENKGKEPFTGTLELELLAPGGKGVKVPLQVAPGTAVAVNLPGAAVAEQGKWPSLLRARNSQGAVVLGARFDTWLRYRPLTIKLIEPNYRGCIYATQKIEQVRGEVRLSLPLEQVKGCVARVTLSGSTAAPATTDRLIEGETVAFELPAADLPVGNYVVRAEVLKIIGDPKARPVKYESLAEGETSLRKLPPAPAVEARVDHEGNLLVNGEPVFIRGWYGSMQYMIGQASLPQAQLPHSTNFMMGSSDFDRADLNLYSLGGLTSLVEEAKAKLDQPIDGDLKAKVREALAKVRHQRNIIGYYISDEPECRGLSPYFLESLHEFICQEDPYRFCMIVSRSPAEYMAGCDVMCPHPYMNPMIKDGKREFGSYLRHIHNVIREAVAANDGSKAIWTMPQTFTYGGLYGTNPDFRESRWFTLTSLANGAKGVVPYIFDGYWNHLPNRVSMDAVFEELAFLARAWVAPGSEREVQCSNPEVDVQARYYQSRPVDPGHVFIVAANQSYGPNKATFNVPALAKGKNTRLLVLRENRVVTVTDGRFTDDFEGLGAHVYTTLEVLPHFKTLNELQGEIAAALQRPVTEGNLLAGNKVRWCIGDWGAAFQSDSDLADGVTNAGGWLPVYTDRTQCVITFEKPVSFSKVVLYTPTIKSADLDIWENGQWRTVHQWQDQFQHRLEWRGTKVTTDRLRIKPTAHRQGYGSWVLPEINELGVYE